MERMMKIRGGPSPQGVEYGRLGVPMCWPFRAESQKAKMSDYGKGSLIS